MDKGSAALLEAFDAVAQHGRQRGRARTTQGWVRVQRLDAETVSLTGPAGQLMAVWSARRRQWRCVRATPGDPPLHYLRGGNARLIVQRV